MIMVQTSRDYIATFFLKRKFVYVGSGFWSSNSKIWNNGEIRAGKNFHMKDASIYIDKEAKVTIGDNVGLNNASIVSVNKVTIGDDVIIGNESVIYDTDYHGIDGKPAKSNPVKIGNHVWIGTKAIILEGVSIGDNSIIGAGSVITRDIPENTIFAGNPARQIGITKTGYTNQK